MVGVWHIFVICAVSGMGQGQGYDIFRQPFSKHSSTFLQNQILDLIKSPLSYWEEKHHDHFINYTLHDGDDSQACEEKVLSLVKSLDTSESIHCKSPMLHKTYSKYHYF